MNSPLKWHGGKHYLAKKIVALMPKHVHYVEPFFGGGSVLLAKDPEGVSEVVNDIHGDLVQFWQTLARPANFEDFHRLCEATPFSEKVWTDSSDLAGLGSSAAPYILRAWAFFVRCRQSLAGRMKDFATLSRTRTRRGMNEQASAWLTAIEGLPDVHSRLRRVVILNRDASDVIRQQDGPDTLFYCDPPYLHETRATTGEYAHEMSEEGHHNLLCLLKQCKGNVLLSGYRSTMYDGLLFDWIRHDFDLPNNSAGGKKKRRMKECVWKNF
jgi:DNA adenine methylase